MSRAFELWDLTRAIVEEEEAHFEEFIVYPRAAESRREEGLGG